MAYMGRKMHSNTLYYIKAQNKYMTYKTEGRGQKKIANFSESVYFMYPKGP